MAEEQGAFDFADVVAAISDKMMRRHPHVFRRVRRGTRMPTRRPRELGSASSARERAGASGDADDARALAGIARGLPEWQRAVKLQKRAARVGFDWPGPAPVIAKLHEEIDEVRVEFARRRRRAARDRLEDEIGDLLFVGANLARHARVDVGAALRHANAKFERRFRAMERWRRARARTSPTLPLEPQDAYWNRAKRERARAGMKTLLLFLLTAIDEIIGCYLPYV